MRLSRLQRIGLTQAATGSRVDGRVRESLEQLGLIQTDLFDGTATLTVDGKRQRECIR